MCDNALATFRTSRYISKCLAFGNAFMIGSITVKELPLVLKETWADPRVEAAPKGGACTGRYLRARIVSIAAHTPKTLKGYKPRIQEFKCVSRLVGLVGGGHYERHICVIAARGTGAAEGSKSTVPAVAETTPSHRCRLLRRSFMRSPTSRSSSGPDK